MLDEPIHLEQYRLEWDEVFRSERNRLAASLEIPLVAIEHIGSTASPGISQGLGFGPAATAVSACA
jgi:GrpB-like predicted nucleotidyltransferase (UPF0157 family)